MVALCLLGTSASAHPGGLNAQGCHNERRTGGYHCHRGTPSPPPRPPSAPAPRSAPVPVPTTAAPLFATPAVPPPQPGTGRAPIVGRANILDGDTIEIGGQRIRLWGIDAFEAAQQCNGDRGLVACGAQATHELTELIADREVICIYRDIDAYQRIVALCRVGTTDLGAHLVRRGLAIAFTRYAQDYVPDEAVARADRVGAWQGSFTAPANYRAGESDGIAAAQRAPSQGECTIKGNINREGERIYHMPGDPFYNRTNPEATFCSEAEAVAAGFRRAGRPR